MDFKYDKKISVSELKEKKWNPIRALLNDNAKNIIIDYQNKNKFKNLSLALNNFIIENGGKENENI